VPISQVHFLDWDTSSVPDSGPTVASRGHRWGNATKRLVIICSKKFTVVAQIVDIHPEELTSGEGKIFSKKTQDLAFL
jgi:hypothetical protein